MATALSLASVQKPTGGYELNSWLPPYDKATPIAVPDDSNYVDILKFGDSAVLIYQKSDVLQLSLIQ